MMRMLKTAMLALTLTAVLGFALSAQATTFTFELHNHPDGNAALPTYGLRLDDLLASGIYTFSFDYTDIVRSAYVVLVYDDVANTITIEGWAFGGKDIGAGYDPGESGWVYLDFLYSANLQESDECAPGFGNDVYVTAESPSNGGTVALDGWGGDQVFTFTDKADGSGCSFVFDNDTDPKGNATIAGNEFIYSGNGWLMPPTSGSRDWIFIADGGGTVPDEDVSWGSLKASYR